MPWVITVIAVCAVIFLIVRDLDWGRILAGWRENVTLVSAALAAISVAFAAWSFGWNKVLERRSATLRAWYEWSSGLRAERMPINKHLHHLEVETAQAVALATPGAPVIDRDGAPLTADQKAELLNAVLAVLNGLEHLAVGVRMGVYNRDVIVRSGGTVVIAMWRRFQPYITEQRRGATAAASQRRAWIELERLVEHIAHAREMEDKQLKASTG